MPISVCASANRSLRRALRAASPGTRSPKIRPGQWLQRKRRTFSRHFVGKEDAALDFTRDDGAAINAALRARPACEPPLVAYRRAVRDWLADTRAPGWHQLPRVRSLLALVDDEPTLFAAFERIRGERSCAVLLVEHDMAFVMRECSRVVVLNLGRRLAEGTPDEIRSHPDVAAAYLGSSAA